jgi:DNA-binding transcriptional LysR family regulator
MTFRYLEIFLCVCDTGNMTAAAKKLYIAQPSVSQAIMELEKYYGVKLFERLGKKLFITQAGQKLMAYARHIINLQAEMEKEMLEIKSHPLIRVGASMTVGTCILSDIVADFYNNNPGVRIASVVDNTKIIEEMLLEDKIDLALVEGAIHSPNLITRPFMDDELVLICSPEHQWAGLDYIERPAIMGAGFIVREEGSGTRELFETVMRENGVNWHPTWVCNNSETIKNAVTADMGIAVISQMSVKREVANKQLSMLRIKNINFKRQFVIVYHKNKFISAKMQAFLDYFSNSQ